MKIIPEKNYRKPVYALGLAAVMMTTALTGCKDKPVDLAGDVQVIESSETEESVMLQGEVAETVDDRVILDGGVSIDDTCNTQ